MAGSPPMSTDAAPPTRCRRVWAVYVPVAALYILSTGDRVDVIAVIQQHNAERNQTDNDHTTYIHESFLHGDTEFDIKYEALKTLRKRSLIFHAYFSTWHIRHCSFGGWFCLRGACFPGAWHSAQAAFVVTFLCSSSNGMNGAFLFEERKKSTRSTAKANAANVNVFFILMSPCVKIHDSKLNVHNLMTLV